MKGLLVLLLAAMPIAAAAQQWTWTEHGYPEDGFAVEFNGMVMVRRMRFAEASPPIIRGTQYTQSDRTQVYTVAASLNRLGVNLAEGAQRSFAGLECGKDLTRSAFDAPWGKGLELRGGNCIDGSYEAEARYYQSGRWFYQVIALYKDAGGDMASARYFLRSFRLTR